ncbi:MAG: hypothetical protein GXP53_11575 [Deltaproteobacteria bacterium]|nr:hypothetical protein [Deltaproteobacteria bacterium]
MPFTQSFSVRYAETGIAGTIKPVSIFNWFQDVASDHCDRLGVSALDLARLGLAWVVHKYEIKFFRYPVWKENICIMTWRSPDKNLYELRAFEVLDIDKNVIARAKSSWILIDLKSKKPLRLNRHLPAELFDESGPKVANDLFELAPPDNPDHENRFSVRMHDLDFNRHVNNAVYVQWATESVPPDIAMQFRPDLIRVHFTNESLYGDVILTKSECNPESNGFNCLHTLINTTSGTETARAETHWLSFETICPKTSRPGT